MGVGHAQTQSSSPAPPTPHPAAVHTPVGFSFLMGFCSGEVTPAWNLPPQTYSTCLKTSCKEETGGYLSLFPTTPRFRPRPLSPRAPVPSAAGR